jgi:hypothetical protein
MLVISLVLIASIFVLGLVFVVIVFKSSPVVREKKECPICEHEVEKLVYLGGLPYYEKWRRERGSPAETNEFLFSYRENGRIVWGLDQRKGGVRYGKRGVK